MASLRQQTKSPFWFACFTLPDGRRTQRSTGATDRRKAQRIANEFEDAANEAASGRFIESRARKAIADIYALANVDTLSSSTVADFMDSWLKRKELEAGEKTHAKYASVVDQFKNHLGGKASRDISNIVAADITKFRDTLAGRVTAGTVNVALKILRSAFAQARRDGLVDVNEAERVTLLKRRDKFERRPFTIDELKRILEVADDEWRGMILFGLYTGQRLGDIATLTWQNLDLQRAELRLVTAKTGRRQAIPIAPPLFRFVESLPAGDTPDAPLFPRTYATAQRHKHAGNLSNQFYSILVAAGMAQKKSHKAEPEKGKGRSAKREQNEVSFHSLRHTATSLLKSAGVGEAIAMEFVGHDNQADDVSHQSRVAQRRLGLMYQYGWVVEQDPVKAFQWFLKSAEQGDAPAQQLVSEAYDSGTGVAQDKAEAAKWFSKAFESFTKSAENGDAWAKAALDSMKTSRDVTPINPHDFGFMQLMALTNSDAVNHMTPEEIASAKPELKVLNETTTARLGETPDQLKARYGEPEFPITNDIFTTITGCDVGRYETYHFTFSIYFHEGHAIREDVSRPGMFFGRGPVDTRGFGLEESLGFFRGATGLTNWTLSTNRENFVGTIDLGLEEVWTNGNIKGFREIKRGHTTAESLSVQAPKYDSVEQAATQRESAREQPEMETAGEQAARLGETQAQTETHYGTPYNSDAPDQHDHTLIMYKWGRLEVLVDFWHGRDIHETFFGTEEHPDLSDVESVELARAATTLQNWNLVYSIGSDRIWHSQPPAKYSAQVTRKPGRETSLMVYGPAYIQYQNEIGGPEADNR